MPRAHMCREVKGLVACMLKPYRACTAELAEHANIMLAGL